MDTALEIRTLLTPIEIREATTDDGQIKRTMIGSINYEKESLVMRDWAGDEFVEEIASGAFDEHLAKRDVVALWSHEKGQVLGNTKSRTLRLKNTKKSLAFECDLPGNSWGDDAYESIRRGDVDGVSFAMRVLKDKWSRVERDGKTLYKRSILNATIPEISPTPFPAYPSNNVSCRSFDEYRREVKRAASELRKRKLAIELQL